MRGIEIKAVYQIHFFAHQGFFFALNGRLFFKPFVIFILSIFLLPETKHRLFLKEVQEVFEVGSSLETDLD